MIPVILSGGSGNRLWPVSRKTNPKQFCVLLDEPLLHKTIKRLLYFGEPYILTVESLRCLTYKCFNNFKLSSKNVICEPFANNTAAAIALICWKFKNDGLLNETIGIFPSDHLITKNNEFYNTVQYAAECATEDKIITLGIKPNYPSTGFGYINCHNNNSNPENKQRSLKVKQFIEKPNSKLANKFLKSNNYLWNSGIYIFRVDTMINALKTHLPFLWQKINSLKYNLSNIEEIYKSIDENSVDKGVIEKHKNLYCVPCDIGWNDLGTWDDISKQIGNENFKNKSSKHLNKLNSFVFSEKNKTIELLDVQDLIVIDTDDALLITKKGSTQNIKKLVHNLSEQNNSTINEGTLSHRPWGEYKVLSEDIDFKIKKIIVNPGSQLSYQSHKKRNEHWVIINGTGEVILNNMTYKITTGSSVYIPKNVKHRIKNTGIKNLEFIEVQSGSYFGEDDIERFNDDYGRI